MPPSITQYLDAVKRGEPGANEALLCLVYDALRRIAANRLGNERANCTLHPTELVHEAWLRLGGNEIVWENRLHFFAAAAEAMRRTLIDNARRRRTQKRGGEHAKQVNLTSHEPSELPLADELLDLHEALLAFEKAEPLKSQIVKLKFFAGMTIQEISAMTNLSQATVERYWAFAKVWLHHHMNSAPKIVDPE